MLDFLHQDKDPETGKVMRRVRSFVLREGRLTHGQRKALDTLWPRYGLERAQGVLDARAEFGRDAPRVLEIGYGMGQSLAGMAEAEPDKDFIGIEVYRTGVGRLLGALDDGAYALLAVLFVSSLLNALYFLPIVVRAFFPTGARPFPAGGGIAEAPVLQLVAISITALGSVALFAYPKFLFDLLGPLVGL